MSLTSGIGPSTGGQQNVPSLRALVQKEIGHCFDVRPLEKGVKVRPPEPQVFCASLDVEA